MLQSPKKPKKLKKSEWGIIWCPCGNLLGDTSLCYETKGGVGVKNITRAYYLCNICESEFDLTKTEKGWEYHWI